jgi:hypothetical protein
MEDAGADGRDCPLNRNCTARGQLYPLAVPSNPSGFKHGILTYKLCTVIEKPITAMCG